MNETRQVVVITTLSFLMFAISAHSKDATKPDGKQLLAWVFLFIALVALSDFPQTATIAAAFAYLIALTAFLTYGTGFFAKITTTLGETVEG